MGAARSARLFPKKVVSRTGLRDRRIESEAGLVMRNLGGGARAVQSGLVNDFNIPEYPEADLWIAELLVSSHNLSLVRGD